MVASAGHRPVFLENVPLVPGLSWFPAIDLFLKVPFIMVTAA